MTDVKWIKVDIDLFENEKIMLIRTDEDADSLIILWLKMLCLAGKKNNHGRFVMDNGLVYTPEIFANVLCCDRALMEKALKLFLEYGMLTEEDGILFIKNWDEYQDLDALERRREADRIRKQRSRDNKYTQYSTCDRACDVTRNTDVTKAVCHVIEKRRVEESREDKSRGDKKNIKSSFSKEKDDGTKPHGASVLALPLNDNSEFEIYEEDVLLWQETYPAVDVRQELKEMKAWCAANPSLRKTRRGIKRFIVTWLSKEQDKGRAGARGTKAAKPQREFVPTEL